MKLDSSSLRLRLATLATALLLCPDTGGAAEIVWQAAVDVARGAGERGPWQQN